MEPRGLFCRVRGMEVKLFRRRKILKEKGRRAVTARRRGLVPAVAPTSLTGWKGEDSDQDFSGVTIWPGPFVCCCASPAWCSLQCWERGSRCGRWITVDLVNLKALFISCIKTVCLRVKTVCVCVCLRFSSSKVLLWLHSLFFSLMSCIFLIQPAVVTSYQLFVNYISNK